MSRRFLELTGIFNSWQLERLQQPAAVIARNHFPYLSDWKVYPKVLDESQSVLIVRHPFDRLLQYYNKNLENSIKNPPAYHLYGRRIVSKYRTVRTGKREPSFAEFIQFLLDMDGYNTMDDAWKPIILKCSPCSIHYKVISHYTTLWQDFNFVWQKAGLSVPTKDLPPKDFDSEFKTEYFSQLSEGQMKSLREKYLVDFDMFNFSLEEHLRYIQSPVNASEAQVTVAKNQSTSTYQTNVFNDDTYRNIRSNS